ncbi:hypothetical protein [Streptomyces sp. Ac-502]|uniref:hypothetical protein n=1 Tax=Streptomyces sp. Ac-502 TaxID=3342801 RepID=UPI0038623037
MTTNDLAKPPTVAGPPIDQALLERLTAAAEHLAKAVPLQTVAPDLKCYTPAEAGHLLGKTENWVTEAIQDRRIPFTYVGKSPRMTAAHIRWVQENGEVLPSKFTRRRTPAAA